MNLFVAAVTLIVGAANYTLRFGDFELGGIALGTFGAIILYQVFKGAPAEPRGETGDGRREEMGTAERGK